MHPVADDGGDILFDIGEGIDAHAGEDPEALILEVLEHRTGGVPIVSVGPGAVGIKEDIVGPTRVPTSSCQRTVSRWIFSRDQEDRLMCPQVWEPKVQPVSFRRCRMGLTASISAARFASKAGRAGSSAAMSISFCVR